MEPRTLGDVARSGGGRWVLEQWEMGPDQVVGGGTRTVGGGARSAGGRWGLEQWEMGPDQVVGCGD